MGSSRADGWRGACAALALALCASSCVPVYQVVPPSDATAAAGSAEALGVGDAVQVVRRGGTTLGGRVAAIDEAAITLEPRGRGAAPVRIARGDIERIERREPGRVLRNILVVSAIVIGVVMVLMAGGPPGTTY